MKEDNESVQLNRKESEGEDLRLEITLERRESVQSEYEICPITELKPISQKRDRHESTAVNPGPLLGMNGRTTELQGIELRSEYF